MSGAPEVFMFVPVDETRVFDHGLSLADPVPGRAGALGDMPTVWGDDRPVLPWNRYVVQALVVEFATAARAGRVPGDRAVMAAFYVASLAAGRDAASLDGFVFGLG